MSVQNTPEAPPSPRRALDSRRGSENTDAPTTKVGASGQTQDAEPGGVFFGR